MSPLPILLARVGSKDHLSNKPTTYPTNKYTMNDMDKLIRSTKRARSQCAIGQLEELLDERSKWKRRETIAHNKLEEVDRAIHALATRMADERLDADLARLTQT